MNCGNSAYCAGRYYLVDAGYALETGYMAPFKNTRYHLDDFMGVDMDTLSRQEKFNFTHSSLRNVVERTFGVLKARWHILHGVPFCHREKQKMIIMSCFAMHNFLWNREIGVGSPTYPPSDWVQINANSTMPLVREYIFVALWG